MTQHEKLSELLTRLELELNAAQLWQERAPTMDKLASQQPFAIDTLDAHEWLQWIFIPKMRELLKNEQTLPSGMAISPYFEQVWLDKPHLNLVISILQDIDRGSASC
ncbi:YqcC family protein [Vibrio sp. S4M6]|uniref:YqcC family protein n=1 Tax=Vibrio sinus TaxID=2946865 RepID=UPI002029FB3A|nr:YqcC family protein [Vibrio sinus]MCL9782774.1 YqcC family protein [Vibrio sinus]